MLDRLLHHSATIKIRRESYRANTDGTIGAPSFLIFAPSAITPLRKFHQR